MKGILGYKESNIDFESPVKIGGKSSEFALHSENKELLIVELKDQSTDLDKPQKNHRNQTP